MKQKRKRILIVNVNWLGDVLFSTAAIKNLRLFYPDSYIASVVVPRCKEVLINNQRLDEIIVYDEKGVHGGLRGKLRFILELRKKKFDTVFLFHRSFTRLLMCFLAGIRERIGYYRRKGGFLLTTKVAPPEGSIHRADYFMYLLHEAGVECKKRECEFFIPDDILDNTAERLRQEAIEDDDFVVALHPGGNWRLKRWLPAGFAELADRLIEDQGARIIILGGRQDVKLAHQIKTMMKHEAVVTAGRTTLSELGAIIKKSALVVSADSGPMHLAVCLKTPVVALFGPTSVKITGPYTEDAPYSIIQKDVGCVIPCYNLACSVNRCMQSIEPEDVLKIIEDMKNRDII